jgi:hypothetical protein
MHDLSQSGDTMALDTRCCLGECNAHPTQQSTSLSAWLLTGLAGGVCFVHAAAARCAAGGARTACVGCPAAPTAGEQAGTCLGSAMRARLQDHRKDVRLSSTPTPTNSDTTEMQGARVNGAVSLSCHVSDGVIRLREAAAPRLLTSTNHTTLRSRIIDQPPKRTCLQPTLKVLINKPSAVSAITFVQSVRCLALSLTVSMHHSHMCTQQHPPVPVQQRCSNDRVRAHPAALLAAGGLIATAAAHRALLHASCCFGVSRRAGRGVAPAIRLEPRLRHCAVTRISMSVACGHGKLLYQVQAET